MTPGPAHLPTLVLASGSRYRAQLLARLGVEFTVDPAAIDESPRAGEDGPALALRLARGKAAAVASRHAGLTLGADQVAVCENRIIGKPGDRDTALGQLEKMSGRLVIYHSAIALLGPGIERVDAIATTVRFRALKRAEIERYLDCDRPFDCAGSLRSEQLGISLLNSLTSDDPTALVGLPLIRVAEWLREAGFPIP